MLAVMFTLESSGGPGDTNDNAELDETDSSSPPAPFASGEPMVSDVDDWTGGLHDGNASGGPCVRFGAAHALYAGTSDARSGRCTHGTRVSSAGSSAITIIPSAPRAKATGSTILFLMVI